jgi:uncharacterized integral membrane protein
MENKIKKQRNKIYYTGWLIILSAISILALVFALRNTVDVCLLPIEKVMSYMGVIATTVGIVITGFFVLLAIDMFSVDRNIRSAKEQLQKDIEDFQNRKKEYNKILVDYAQSLSDSLEIQIGLASSSSGTNNTSLLECLTIKRARLSYKYPMLGVLERVKLLINLGNVGELQDIIPIQGIIDNEREPEEIRKVAQKVLEELKKKCGIV